MKKKLLITIIIRVNISIWMKILLLTKILIKIIIVWKTFPLLLIMYQLILFQSIPSKIKKKPTDYKIRAFVGFLFLCIVFFVGFAYIMYHQQVLAGAYFEKIKFSKGNREIKVFNKEGAEIMNGHLGELILNHFH